MAITIENWLLISFVILWISFCTIAQISMKIGINNVQKDEPLSGFFNFNTIYRFLNNPNILGGFFLYVFATFLWLGALSKLDVSVLSPLGSLIFVCTAIAALFLLGEKISPFRWFSIMLITLGTFLLIRS
jgi:multidrug transporter EmrE-like cation transporter